MGPHAPDKPYVGRDIVTVRGKVAGADPGS